MKRVGAAWKANGKSGPYLSINIDLGVMGTVKAMMFPNTKKTEPNQADYNIVIPDDEVKTSKAHITPKPQAGLYKKPVIIPRPQPTNFAPGGPPEPPNDLWDRSDAEPEFP